jgi:hypothetical protein
MNDQIQQMSDVVTGVINGVFITTGKSDVGFKKMIELERGGDKNLLVVGSIHRDYDDGCCVGVLNPDDELAEWFIGGAAYPSAIIKERVAGHCKAMVIMTCSGRRTFLSSSYRARSK